MIIKKSEVAIAYLSQPIVEQFLTERGLGLSSEKIAITHISNDFDVFRLKASLF
ncbi:hypothetical protein [Scytonema hofmannii]|uniref:hypothetical protein n=1 Tax=Scytonema hofmannii TaxID=34078 RepID=UPI000349FB52|nr:hypothetical protein [Scytonema hofmannii]